MQYHSKIKFTKTPTIWVKDKWEVGLNQTNMFIVAIIPGVFGLFGMISNIITIFKIDPANLNITLLWFLFIYGLFISMLIFSHQRVNFRMRRDRGIFNIIHKNIAEKIRDYLAMKRNRQLNEEDIIKFIKEILSSFNDNFMKIMHRSSVAISVKYLVKGELYPIRVGNDILRRDYNPELSANSPVYNALTQLAIFPSKSKKKQPKNNFF